MQMEGEKTNETHWVSVKEGRRHQLCVIDRRVMKLNGQFQSKEAIKLIKIVAHDVNSHISSFMLHALRMTSDGDACCA